MIKRIVLSVLIGLLCLVPLSPVPVEASPGPMLVSSSVEVNFPATLSFTLSAKSDANITDIRLLYRVDQMDFADVTSEVYCEFEPANAVETRWDWDMRRTGGLPPAASVEYWWRIEDAAGGRIETRPETVRFDDSRYQWRNITEGQVTMYWYQGNEAFAARLMTAAQQALKRLSQDAGAALERPVRLYIYGSARDLQGSMIFPREWTGGVTFTRYGTIAIGISPGEVDWGIRAIAHELTHLVVHQVTFNPYGDLPTWLDEGLAMYAEGDLEPTFAGLLDSAIAAGSIISVRGLSSPFSAYARESSLSYAQSQSLVKFLIDNYGQGKMFELLNVFERGSGYDEALSRVYGFDMDGLDALWRASVGASAAPVQQPVQQPVRQEGMNPALAWIVAALVTVAVLLPGFFVVRRLRRQGG